jgi:hypothetical protein
MGLGEGARRGGGHRRPGDRSRIEFTPTPADMDRFRTGVERLVHGVRGLWVFDASIFHTNLDVNPQHPIMALAMLLAERIAA